MPNLKTIEDTTAVLMDTTPLAGGSGREAKVHLGDNLAVVSGVLLEGNNGVPHEGAPSTGWYTLIEGGGDAAIIEVLDLPQWVRLGGAATDPIVMEGVQ